jgi:hypothetical protein
MTLFPIGILSHCNSREEVIEKLLLYYCPKSMLEIGVWKGELSFFVLETIKSIESYHLLDPWKCLKNWNKPFNRDDNQFKLVYDECMERLSPYSDKITVHRATSATLDFSKMPKYDVIYIDGDHTLRGIAIDLIKARECLAPSGVIICDDYTKGSIFQHGLNYEPSFVYPYCDYFCEACDWECIELPFNQLLIDSANPYDTSGVKPSLKNLLHINENSQHSGSIYSRVVRKIQHMFDNPN